MAADEADQAKALLLAGLQNYSATYLQAITHPTLTGAISELLGGHGRRISPLHPPRQGP